jgi:E3 ubiquitin-protein ligase XBAT32/33
LVEAKMLLDCNPCLAKYSTFGGLNSPLHFAAAKGHNEVKRWKKGNFFSFWIFGF